MAECNKKWMVASMGAGFPQRRAEVEQSASYCPDVSEWRLAAERAATELQFYVCLETNI